MLESSAAISHCGITTCSEKGLSDPTDIFVFSSNWMDHGRSTPRRPPLYSHQSSPDLQEVHASRRRRPLPHSSPLQQAQWSDNPLPYRPRDLPQPEDELPPQYPPDHGLPGWHRLQAAPEPPEPSLRRRRRSRDWLSSEKNERRDEPFDISMLYPQVNQYDDRSSSYSAPDELEFCHERAASQTSASNDARAPMSNDEPPSFGLPRSPTYPPDGKRPTQRTAAPSDDFADDEEFRLFVEATAGLGPEQAFRPSTVQPLSVPTYQRPPTSQSTSGDIVSPLGETPTTMYALQQLAQMPEEPTNRQPQDPASGIDWMRPPSPSEEILNVSLDDVDDELPDYAASQAQAQASQRAEATRRAQELQRRWQLSGARRGM